MKYCNDFVFANEVLNLESTLPRMMVALDELLSDEKQLFYYAHGLCGSELQIQQGLLVCALVGCLRTPSKTPRLGVTLWLGPDILWRCLCSHSGASLVMLAVG